MKLYDMYFKKEYSIPELYTEFQEVSKTEPWNHAENFTEELFEVLMATVNGRNDCEVVGMTPAELNRYILSLRSVVERK